MRAGSNMGGNSVPLWGPDPAFAERWRPLRTGAGHGRSGRPPGRCGCAVTSLLQRDGGGAGCFRQGSGFPRSPSLWRGDGSAGVAAPGQRAVWAPLGLRSGGGLIVSVLTPRASAVVGGAATGQANGASDGAGDVVVIPRSWMVAVGARVDVIAPSTDGGTAALGRVSSSSSAST